MANYSSPLAICHAPMNFFLVLMYKRPGLCPMGIGETLRRYLAKLVMRASGDQEKNNFGNIQMFVDLEAGMERATHAVGGRMRYRREGGIWETE